MPGEDYAAAAAAGLDVTAYSVAELDEIVGRAASARRAAQGRHRALPRGAAAGRLAGRLRARRAASSGRGGAGHRHLVALRRQRRPRPPGQRRPGGRLRATRSRSRGDAGLRPEVRHLANSAAALLRPEARYDLVRCGIASYGLDPAPGVTPDLGLRPAMTVRADLALVKRIAAGAGVSYGHTWVAERDTTVGSSPSATARASRAPRATGSRCGPAGHGVRSRGRVCMDQFVVDLGDDELEPGDDVVLFGPGDRRRAHGAGLGRGPRHHQLRDRDADRRPPGAAATWTEEPHERRTRCPSGAG